MNLNHKQPFCMKKMQLLGLFLHESLLIFTFLLLKSHHSYAVMGEAHQRSI